MAATPSKTDLFESFKNLKVAIVGDVMVDAYIYGHVDRISPEAPVPVLLVNRREQRPGGAANVAMNIKAMGATPLLISMVGDDSDGSALLNLLEDKNIASGYIAKDPGRVTTTKTRIIAKGHQMMRLDHENSNEISEELENILLEHIATVVKEETPDVLIFQDYNKGLLTEKIIRGATMICLNNNIPVAVDPKKRHFSSYQMCTLFKPNLGEISDNLLQEIDPKDIESLRAAALSLNERLHNGITLITLSDKGVFLHSGEHTLLEPAHVRDVADVSGAGDTVISIAALCLAARTSLPTLAALSNLAGGIVCEYQGVVSIDEARLAREARQHGIV